MPDAYGTIPPAELANLRSIKRILIGRVLSLLKARRVLYFAPTKTPDAERVRNRPVDYELGS